MRRKEGRKDIRLGDNNGLLLGTIHHHFGFSPSEDGWSVLSRDCMYATAARHSGSIDGRPKPGPQMCSSIIDGRLMVVGLCR